MNPLEQLSDIHVPEEVNVWPLAWGWWLLIVCILISLCLVTIWLYRYHRARRLKRIALKELTALNSDDEAVPAKVNQLLKRVALSYFPTAPVATLYGDKWCAFLTQQLPRNKQQDFESVFEELQQSLYQKRTYSDSEASIKVAKLWIQSSVPPNKKQLLLAQGKETNHV